MTTMALLLLCVPAWSCQRQHPDAEPMTPETFTKVVVALRRADAQSETVEQFDERKKEILASNGVTADQMREFVRDYSEKPQQMAALWDTIEARLRQPRPDTTSRDTLRTPSLSPASDSARVPGVSRRRGPVLRPPLRRPGAARPDTLPRPDTLHRPGPAHPPGAAR